MSERQRRSGEAVVATSYKATPHAELPRRWPCRGVVVAALAPARRTTTVTVRDNGQVRHWRSLGSALWLVLVACGGGSTVSASSDATVASDGIPIGPASSLHWMAGELPEGYQVAFSTEA